MSKNYTYVLSFRFPSSKAHSIYVAQSCEAARKNGLQTTLVVPKFANLPKTDNTFWKDQLIPKPINIIRLLGFDPAGTAFIHRLLTKRFVYQISTLFFSLQAVVWLLYKRPTVVQTGNPELVLLLNLVHLIYKPSIVLDFHIDPPRWINSSTTKNLDLVVVNAQSFKDQLVKQRVDSSKIEVMPNGVNIQGYQKVKTDSLLDKLNISRSSFVVSYIGRFETMQKEKGIYKMLDALAILVKTHPQKDIIGLIVGGPKKYIKLYKKYAQKIGLSETYLRFVDQVPYNQVPRYISISSVGWLVYPRVPHFIDNMSPMKLMEYSAAGKSLICSDFPSLKNMISNDLVSFVNPDSSKEQVVALETYLLKKDTKGADRQSFANQWTWEKRQQKIFEKVGII